MTCKGGGHHNDNDGGDNDDNYDVQVICKAHLPGLPRSAVETNLRLQVTCEFKQQQINISFIFLIFGHF